MAKARLPLQEKPSQGRLPSVYRIFHIQFIQESALERNDPNLTIDFPERRNMGPRNTSRNDEINLKKTEVEFEHQANGRNPPPRSPANWCIVQHKPHPLSKCRAFLAKPLDEKTKKLRQNRVCFLCIASCDHFAKDCKVKIACTECKSDKNLAAKSSERTAKRVKRTKINRRMGMHLNKMGNQTRA